MKTPLGLALSILLTPAGPAGAQVMEVVGSRALGMAGAFVAVADDGSATWWNPAGLALGPFVDLSLGRTWADKSGEPGVVPANWVTLSTLPFGVGYYAFREPLRDAFHTTAPIGPRRQEGRAEAPDTFRSVRHFGATFVQTLVSGVHMGTTVKYLRATEEGSREGSPTDGGMDLDLGILAASGPFRAGAVVRNLRRVELGGHRGARQARAGVAVELASGGQTPTLVAVDSDLTVSETGWGRRRVVAVGGETWMAGRRIGLRGGARFNTVGARQRSVAVGASAAVRRGVYVEGHAVGGARLERGWGVSIRATF